MKELQMTFYDVISIILPASLVLAIVHFYGLFHNDLFKTITDDVLNAQVAIAGDGKTGPASLSPIDGIASFTVAFVVAYLLGYAINIAAKLIQDSETKWKHILVPRWKKSSTDQVVYFKESFPVTLDQKNSNMLTKKLQEFYGIQFRQDDKSICQYLMGTLTSDQSHKRDTFISVAGMLRNTALVALFFALYFIYELFYAIFEKLGTTEVMNDFIYIVIGVVAYFLFRRGFAKYQTYAEELLVYAFLTVPQPENLHWQDGHGSVTTKQQTAATKEKPNKKD